MASPASAVHVVVRVRPQNAKEDASGGKLAVKLSANEIRVDGQGDFSASSGGARFTFDKVFAPDSLQVDVFAAIGKPLVATVFEG